jgi:NAD(P)-dependent dehydrogenase (short-subunit alcohol dehydrogenase family)
MNKAKVAFITGANRGVGFETARELGRMGILVMIGSRDAKLGKAAVKKLRMEGVEAASLVFDVTNPRHHQSAYNYFVRRHRKLDILINNAGVWKESQSSTSGAPVTPPSEVSPRILRETFETNFFGPVALTQKLLPLIRKAPAGRIVNVSSILGSLTLHTNPDSPIHAVNVLAYDSSKTALNAFTVHLAHELRGTQIKVNAAHPGWAKTAMGGPDAPMEVAESGKTSAHLATLPDDGPTGGFYHGSDSIPW